VVWYTLIVVPQSNGFSSNQQPFRRVALENVNVGTGSQGSLLCFQPYIEGDHGRVEVKTT
jgi:hypothetical protein